MSRIERERQAFEAAGTKLHGWDERDYRRPEQWGGIREGDYIWMEQRRAFALWLVARGIST